MQVQRDLFENDFNLNFYHRMFFFLFFALKWTKQVDLKFVEKSIVQGIMAVFSRKFNAFSAVAVGVDGSLASACISTVSLECATPASFAVCSVERV